MKKNMGNTDRVIRLMLAAVLAIGWFQGFIPGIPGIISLVVAGIFVLTAFIGICPLYSLFGIHSCPRKNK